MEKSEYIKRSLMSAVGVLGYVFLVALLMSNGKNIFGPDEGLLIPVFMMLLFVVSASTTGFLVLGKPVSMYLDGLKKEAFILLFATLGWLVALLISVITVLLLNK